MPNSSKAWIGNGRWPAHCCVPAFVYAALNINGIDFLEPASLPSLLGVHVGPDDDNPLGLPLAEMDDDRGVTVTVAERMIQAMLDELELPIFFRYLPFKEIPLGLYEDVLSDALNKGLVIGLGVDVSKLSIAQCQDKALHVLRVVNSNYKYVMLFDDSYEFVPPELICTWDEVERSVLAAKGGFWLFGPKIALSLVHTALPTARNI